MKVETVEEFLKRKSVTVIPAAKAAKFEAAKPELLKRMGAKV